jgi:hypothetical protein
LSPLVRSDVPRSSHNHNQASYRLFYILHNHRPYDLPCAISFLSSFYAFSSIISASSLWLSTDVSAIFNRIFHLADHGTPGFQHHHLCLVHSEAPCSSHNRNQVSHRLFYILHNHRPHDLPCAISFLRTSMSLLLSSLPFIWTSTHLLAEPFLPFLPMPTYLWFRCHLSLPLPCMLVNATAVPVMIPLPVSCKALHYCTFDARSCIVLDFSLLAMWPWGFATSRSIMRSSFNHWWALMISRVLKSLRNDLRASLFIGLSIWTRDPDSTTSIWTWREELPSSWHLLIGLMGFHVPSFLSMMQSSSHHQ